MKQYLLFAGYSYYPQGGARDFKGDFDSIDECEKEYEKLKETNSYGRHDIMDTKNNKIRYRGYKNFSKLKQDRWIK